MFLIHCIGMLLHYVCFGKWSPIKVFRLKHWFKSLNRSMYMIFCHLTWLTGARMWVLGTNIKVSLMYWNPPLRVWRVLQSILLILLMLNMQRHSCLMWRSTWWLTTSPQRFVLNRRGDSSHLESCFTISEQICKTDGDEFI